MCVKHILRALWSRPRTEPKLSAMKNPNQALGHAIASMRKAQSLNQTELAERADIDQPAISKIERGMQEVTQEKLVALAGALGVRVADIWALAEQGAAPDSRAHGARLTIEGSTKPPSKELQSKHRSPNDIRALQWVIGSLVGYMVSSRPDEAEDIVKALEAIPEKFQETGPGGALLAQLDEIRAVLAEAAGQRISKPRGTAQALKRSRS